MQSDMHFREQLLKVSPMLVEEFDVLYAELAGWSGVQHRADGTHEEVSERGRTTPMGEWITPVFSAANFVGEGSLTWTVEIDDVQTFKYMLIGLTMWLTVYIDTSTLSGTADNGVKIKIPGGYLAQGNVAAACQIVDAGTGVAGTIYSDEQSDTRDHLYVHRVDDANFTNGTNNFYVRASLAFEIQEP